MWTGDHARAIAQLSKPQPREHLEAVHIHLQAAIRALELASEGSPKVEANAANQLQDDLSSALRRLPRGTAG